jgi:hypothetical protein
VRRPRLTPSMGVSLVALVVAASGGAYAAVGGSPGVIRACVHRTGGGLYIARHCARHDKGLAWSATGPSGSRGLQGPQGLQGPPGLQGQQGVAWFDWTERRVPHHRRGARNESQDNLGDRTRRRLCRVRDRLRGDAKRHWHAGPGLLRALKPTGHCASGQQSRIRAFGSERCPARTSR